MLPAATDILLTASYSPIPSLPSRPPAAFPRILLPAYIKWQSIPKWYAQHMFRCVSACVCVFCLSRKVSNPANAQQLPN